MSKFGQLKYMKTTFLILTASVIFSITVVPQLYKYMDVSEMGEIEDDFQRREDSITFKLPPNLEYHQIKQVHEALVRANSIKKVIIEWFPINAKTIRKVSPNCGYCEITSNRSRINETETAAIVFNYRKINATTMPPQHSRRTDQLYVWQTGEAPSAVLFLYKRYLQFEENYRFNATQSFRRDADVYHPYGGVDEILLKKRRVGLHKNLTRVLDGKTNVAVTVISNCHFVPGANIRLQFVRDLIGDGLNVHTFGRCFENKTFEKPDKTNFRNLLKTYKFYLAFENSYNCRDYITEKFFVNGLESGSVPIVWGGTKRDYDAIAPPKSYIYADDFKTTKELIEYINYLNENNTAYLEYFKWYTTLPKDVTDYGRQMRYCQLCRIVHGINVDDVYSPAYNKSSPERPLVADKMSPRTLKSLYNWYFKEENRNCLKSSSRFYRDNVSLAARTLNGRT